MKKPNEKQNKTNKHMWPFAREAGSVLVEEERQDRNIRYRSLSICIKVSDITFPLSYSPHSPEKNPQSWIQSLFHSHGIHLPHNSLPYCTGLTPPTNYPINHKSNKQIDIEKKPEKKNEKKNCY